MTSPDPAAILAQINSARDQTYQNLALLQAQANVATDAAEAAARDRAAVAAMSQQAVTVDTSVGTRVFAGDVMIFGDTGWRDVTSLLSEAPTTGQVRIRRTTNHVDIVVNGVVWPTIGTRFLQGLGSAWGTFHSSYPHVSAQLVGSNPASRQGSVNAAWNGEHRISQYDQTAWIYLTVTIPAQRIAWPTSLPGTAA